MFAGGDEPVRSGPFHLVLLLLHVLMQTGPGCFLPGQSDSTMSTSDSDYSIDWLASDEDDYDGPKTFSPERVEEPAAPPSPPSPSSSSSALRPPPPPSSLHCAETHRRRRCWRRRRSGGCCCCDCKDGAGCDPPASLQNPAVSPVQGFTSICAQQTLPVASERQAGRKRAHGAGPDGFCGKPPADTENDLFAQKCAELQRFIQPLSSILRGLRSGRYSERLSSFQESVAMDRIQRIMGVLQNPNLGGRFLTILLKIEEMLHSWFPRVKTTLMQSDDDGSPAKKQKQHHHCSASPPPPSSDVELPLAASYSSTHLKWLHTSPICSLKTPESTLGQRSASPLPARCRLQEVTQDNAVSSSTDLHTGPQRRRFAEPRLVRGPLPFKISSPCLERLLQAKESIIAPRTVGGGGWSS
ncbi:uncharacterized protein LOC119018366 isoform X3 [Acanthopagrus latus]|uniref:uncharacterized protein LOC119018366 isoform X3 n=1 Tax=Acanthopagrus latus TaxID=8177 RepID=UPI00187C22EB|nr:uncharacterized protein LOC119018366 isoform X3 [Acanthopagrus latus]